MLGGIALLVTVLTLFADNPPGIDTPGHLFKAWAIARDAERNFFSTHAWTQYWYNGHPLYHYYPPASYFVIASIDYLLNNIDASYRIFIFLSFLGGSLTAFR